MKKLLLAMALIGGVGYGAYQVFDRDDEQPTVKDSEQLVLDRIWIDHMPRNERDMIQVFAAISEEPFGVFQASSTWKGQYELFRYAKGSNELRITYPQTNERETIKHKARRCTDNSFDYCLELDGGSRGVKKYYSRKGWEIDGASSPDDVAKRTEQLIHTLGHGH